MVKSLGKSIIYMYSMGACSVLGITNQDALSEDLENDPFLNSALQRLTYELNYRFGSQRDHNENKVYPDLYYAIPATIS